jgi:hypothetical protein
MHVEPTNLSTNPYLQPNIQNPNQSSQHIDLHREHGQTKAKNILSLSISNPSNSHPNVVKKTSRPWNRDICGSLNILRILFGHVFDNLPVCFQRSDEKPKKNKNKILKLSDQLVQQSSN